MELNVYSLGEEKQRVAAENQTELVSSIMESDVGVCYFMILCSCL